MQEEIKYLLQYEAIVHLYITITSFFGKFVSSFRSLTRYKWLIILTELNFLLAIRKYTCQIPFHPLVLRL